MIPIADWLSTHFTDFGSSPVQTTDDNFPMTFVKTGLFDVGQVPPVRQVLFDRNRESWDSATWEGAEVKELQ